MPIFNNLNSLQKKFLESHLPNTYDFAVTACRWLALQSVNLQLIAIEKSRKEYFELVKELPSQEKTLLSLLASLKVASNLYKTNKVLKRKGTEFTEKELQVLDELKANHLVKNSRPAKKRKFLQVHKEEILSMRANGYSLRDIASFFITPDGETISYELIRKFVKDQNV